MVSPDRALWQVPFQGRMSTRGKFVVEEHAISYAPSLSAIAAIEDRRRARPRRPPFLLALGDPALATNAAAAPTRAGDGRLPNAAREVRALGALYGASTARGPDRTRRLRRRPPRTGGTRQRPAHRHPRRARRQESDARTCG